jgi:hypothetical protein
MTKPSSLAGVLGSLVLAIAALDAGGCTSPNASSPLPASGTITSASTGAGGMGGAGGSGGMGGENLITETCKGLECSVQKCGTKDGTTVTGTVFAPNGSLPLYNVVVYIPKFPEKPLPPFKFGASCDQCATTIEDTVSVALTDARGKFTLKNAPVGTNIPLVMQIGKWRRKVLIPSVSACKETAVTNAQLTRLPRTQKEGDIPQMAVVTGGCDPLACLFRKMGLADEEFTDSTSKGKMHVFKGQGGVGVDNGNALAPEKALWSSKEKLAPYDVVLLSCECSEYNETKTAEQKGFMRDYLDVGGRMFATHYHYTWFKNGPAEFQTVAEWKSVYTNNPYSINQSFPKGQAFAEWLEVNNAAKNGEIKLTNVREDVGTISAAARAWIYKQPPQTTVKYFTFNTPLAAAPDKQCGRAVFSDIHVSEAATSGNFPSGCDQTPMTDQEKALVFLFFDLAACISPDDKPPEPPNPT